MKQFQDLLPKPLRNKKTSDVGPNDAVTVDIFGDDDMKNIITPKPSYPNIFKDVVRMRMETLSTKMGDLHTLY